MWHKFTEAFCQCTNKEFFVKIGPLTSKELSRCLSKNSKHLKEMLRFIPCIKSFIGAIKILGLRGMILQDLHFFCKCLCKKWCANKLSWRTASHISYLNWSEMQFICHLSKLTPIKCVYKYETPVKSTIKVCTFHTAPFYLPFGDIIAGFIV